MRFGRFSQNAGERLGREEFGRGRGFGRRMRSYEPGHYRAGPGGECECPQCNKKFSHIVGEPCMYRTCPDCGTKLVRKID